MLIKDICIFSFCDHFVQLSATSLCNFSREHYEEHFNDIILYLSQWFEGCCLKIFLFLALGAILIFRT